MLKWCLETGYKIKKGWNVNIDVRSLHTDPCVYNDPAKFNPYRFDVRIIKFNFIYLFVYGI